MTIYKLERESTAWRIIPILHSTYTNVDALVSWLEDTARTITTVEILTYRSSWTNAYILLNNFNNEHGTWFATAWSDYINALTGVITSLQNINNVINQGIHDWYWDYDTDKPIISELSQIHRNQLANQIKLELE